MINLYPQMPVPAFLVSPPQDELLKGLEPMRTQNLEAQPKFGKTAYWTAFVGL